MPPSQALSDAIRVSREQRAQLTELRSRLNHVQAGIEANFEQSRSLFDEADSLRIELRMLNEEFLAQKNPPRLLD